MTSLVIETPPRLASGRYAARARSVEAASPDRARGIANGARTLVPQGVGARGRLAARAARTGLGRTGGAPALDVTCREGRHGADDEVTRAEAPATRPDRTARQVAPVLRCAGMSAITISWVVSSQA